MPDRGTFRIAAIDLDRTLLRTDGSLSPETRRVLTAARAGGLELVAVTARSYTELTQVRGVHELFTVALCCSGGSRYRLDSPGTPRTAPLSEPVAGLLVEHISAIRPGTVFGWITLDHLTDPGTGATTARETTFDYQPHGPGRPVVKLFARSGPPGTDPGFPSAVEARIGDLAQIGHRSPAFVELIAREAGKLNALREHCRRRGVGPGEVIAFGDSAGDIPMLRWAGRSVAVANAPAEVRDAADEVAPSCDDDGVARILAALG